MEEAKATCSLLDFALSAYMFVFGRCQNDEGILQEALQRVKFVNACAREGTAVELK